MWKAIQYLKYKIKWYMWFFKPPYRWGDPLLGNGELRNENRRVLIEKYNLKEPKKEDFGL